MCLTDIHMYAHILKAEITRNHVQPSECVDAQKGMYACTYACG
jgi:hypothetical protein